MDKASLTGKMEITIKELTMKTRGTDMVRCFGLTVPNTKVNGSLVLSTDKVNFGYQMGTIKKDCSKITFMLVKWDKLKLLDQLKLLIKIVRIKLRQWVSLNKVQQCS